MTEAFLKPKDALFIMFGITLLAVFIGANTAQAEKRLEVRQEEQCRFVLDPETVKLGKATAFVPLDLEGTVQENFAKVDGAVCAFGLAYPNLSVTSVYVEKQQQSNFAPVVAKDKITGLLLGLQKRN